MGKCVVIGGGTFNTVACHLSLAAPAFGTTARQLEKLLQKKTDIEVVLTLTKMADYNSNIISNDDLQNYVNELLKDLTIKVIIFNAAVCDFSMDNPTDQQRLSSANNYNVVLNGITKKILQEIKIIRPDIFVVGFKTTAGATESSQIQLGEKSLISNNADLVLANDTVYKRNILISNNDTIHGSREMLLQLIADISAIKGTQ